MAAVLYDVLKTEGKLTNELVRSFRPRPKNYIIAWKEGRPHVALIKCKFGVCILEKPGELPIKFWIYARVIERVVSQYGIEAVNSKQRILFTIKELERLNCYIRILREKGCSIKGNILKLFEGAILPPVPKTSKPRSYVEAKNLQEVIQKAVNKNNKVFIVPRGTGVAAITREEILREYYRIWVPRNKKFKLPDIKNHGWHRRKKVRVLKKQRARYNRLQELQARVYNSITERITENIRKKVYG